MATFSLWVFFFSFGRGFFGNFHAFLSSRLWRTHLYQTDPPGSHGMGQGTNANFIHGLFCCFLSTFLSGQKAPFPDLFIQRFFFWCLYLDKVFKPNPFFGQAKQTTFFFETPRILLNYVNPLLFHVCGLALLTIQIREPRTPVSPSRHSTDKCRAWWSNKATERHQPSVILPPQYHSLSFTQIEKKRHSPHSTCHHLLANYPSSFSLVPPCS